jgi:hypothetical protein
MGEVAMAIRYFHVDILNADDGDSAVGLSAYLSRGELTDETLDEHFDMRRHAKPFDAAAYIARDAQYNGHHEDVLHHCMLLPAGCHPSFGDAQKTWSRAHRAEVVTDRKTGETRFRKGAQIAKHGIGALAKELTPDQAVECALGFVQREIVDKGLIAQVAIHKAPTKFLKDGTAISTGNIHFHVLWTTRRPEGEAFGKKARDLNPTFKGGKVDEGDDWNQTWEDYQHAYFARLGLAIRVDPHAELPRVRLGKAAYLKASWKQDANREIEAIEREMHATIAFEKGRVLSASTAGVAVKERVEVVHVAEPPTPQTAPRKSTKPDRKRVDAPRAAASAPTPAPAEKPAKTKRHMNYRELVASGSFFEVMNEIYRETEYLRRVEAIMRADAAARDKRIQEAKDEEERKARLREKLSLLQRAMQLLERLQARIIRLAAAAAVKLKLQDDVAQPAGPFQASAPPAREREQTQREHSQRQR